MTGCTAGLREAHTSEARIKMIQTRAKRAQGGEERKGEREGGGEKEEEVKELNLKMIQYSGIYATRCEAAEAKSVILLYTTASEAR